MLQTNFGGERGIRTRPAQGQEAPRQREIGPLRPPEVPSLGRSSGHTKLAARHEWVGPLEAGEAGKVVIRRAKRGAMFQSESRNNGVHDQRPERLAFAHQATQDVPMAFARLDNASGGLSKPGRNRGLRLCYRERMLERARIRANSHERPQRQPGKTDKLLAGEDRLEPGSACCVLLGPRVIRVQQQIRVDKNQR